MKFFTPERLLRNSPSVPLIIFVFFIFMNISVSASDMSAVETKPTPDWVITRSIAPIKSIPINEISEGTYFRLLDDQIRVNQKAGTVRYFRLAKTVVNQSGIGNSSQLNFDYDPAYQKLTVHSVDVHRDGKIINKLSKARISVIQREESLENQIYDGTLTANIILDDVREGDTLDYSYSLSGDNPVYNGIFSTQRTISWAVPVMDQYVRVLWGKSAPLQVSMHNIEAPVIKQDIGGYLTYQVHLHDQAIVESNSEVPDWYYPYGTLYFSETKDWGDVVNWARPLYSSSKQDYGSVQAIARQVEAMDPDKGDQIANALKFVQNEIRYLGLENGMNSHLPAVPDTTLSLRYGDCKAKAVLFISILNQLGIDAFPVLVDTYYGMELDKYPAMINSFNHVIVTFNYQGQQYWLDPTLTYQKGPLSAIYQPDYGFGLVIKPGNTTLTAMHERIKTNSYRYINEEFVVHSDIEEPVRFSINTAYLGNMAQKVLYDIDNRGIKDQSERYLNYYQRYYPEMTQLNEVEVGSDVQTGVLEIAKRYSIASFWEKEEEGFTTGFYARSIRNALYLPEQVKRTSPLYFRYPNNIKNTIQVHFASDNWMFDDDEFIEDNPFFYFKYQSKFSQKVLTLTFNFQSRTDHIPADDIAAYLEARDRVRDKTYYGIIKYFPATAIAETQPEVEADVGDNTQNIYLTVGIFYLAGCLFILLSWRLESRKRPEFKGSHYYPIAIFKFILLSVMTRGIYLSYWMYRNWKYLKNQDRSSIMPIARSFFFPIFWFYPLYNRLADDSNERFQGNRVFAKPLAILFAVGYFLLFVGASFSIYEELMIFSIPFLFIPLVNYINHINESDSDAYDYNSKWHARHIVACLLFIPILVMGVSRDVNLLPSQYVVGGEQIWQHDIKFLQRNKVIEPGEEVVLFYSDAFFTMQDDGNGFTESTVFSYWKDEEKNLHIKTVLLADVKDIKVEFAEKERDNTVITIVLDDDNSFILYVAADKKRDKQFVTELKSRWRKSLG